MTDICNRLHKFHLIFVGHVREYSVPFSLKSCCYSLKLIQAADSLFKKTNKSSASQYFPRILRKPKVHKRVFNSLPLFSNPSQRDPIQVLLSHSFKMNFNIILPSTSRSFKLPHSFRFPCNLVIKFTVMY